MLISPLAAEIWGTRLTALCSNRVIASVVMKRYNCRVKKLVNRFTWQQRIRARVLSVESPKLYP